MKSLIYVTALFLIFVPVSTAFDPPSMRSIESAYMYEIENSFFVIFRKTADLSPARSMATREERGRFVFETLRSTAESSQVEIRAWLDQNDIEYQPYWIQNMILVRAGQDVREILSRRPEVASIRSERYFQAIDPETLRSGRSKPESRDVEWNIQQIRADEVWREMGVRGEGIVVCDADTGVDWQHPSLINQYRGWDGITADHNYNWYDATGTSPMVPIDDNGHGTHTTGTMVGDDGEGNQIGVAPKAQWIGVKNMNAQGGGQDSWFHNAFQWILAPTDLNGENPDPSQAPHVVNNSWGYMGADRIFEPDVAALVAAGIMVEVSAGNEGPGCATLRSPGDYELSFTTGSTNQGGLISSFSSRGPSRLYPNITKPEVVAPGANVRSCVPGGGYQSFSGTSMAGPHTCGQIALLWSANPDLIGDIDTTREIIQQTAVFSDVNECETIPARGSNNVYGWGEIDCYAAVLETIPPQSAGILHLDKLAYKCNDELVIMVKDSDIAGTGSIMVTVFSTTEYDDPEELWLPETDDPGVFIGSIMIEEGPAVPGDGILQVSEDDQILVDYLDENHGDAGQVVITKTAEVICTPPIVFDIEIGRLSSDSAQILWKTDIPSTTGIHYGETYPFENKIILGRYNEDHMAAIANLEACTDYMFMIEAVDYAGNSFIDDNNGEFYTFKTFQTIVAIWENMDTDPGWVAEGDWEWGKPEPAGGNPSSGMTGENVYGFNLEGAYDHNLPKYALETPPLDLTNATSTTVSFAMWLGVGQFPQHQASWDVSLDGGQTWNVLFNNAMFGGPFQMNFWMPLEIDMGEFVDGFSDVRFRWTLGPTGDSGTFSGWNLDDIVITFDADCDVPTPTPRPTVTPTPEPTPEHPLGVRIDMPEIAHPGDIFYVTGHLDNPDSPMLSVPTFFILEVYGMFWFWPSFVQFDPPDFPDIDFMLVNVPTGTTTISVLDPFSWPDTGQDTVTGLWFFGAMLDQNMSYILGEMAAQEFGYGPETQ